MYTVSFYSFKGGVGRSLAAANTALLLAERGKKVVLVDFDLEAPGLTFMPEFASASKGPGLCEYIQAYKDNFGRRLEAAGELEQGGLARKQIVSRLTQVALLPPVKDYIHRCRARKSDPPVPGKISKSIRFMPAGAVDDSYFQRVDALDFETLYGVEEGDSFFRLFKDAVAKTRFGPDYLIIDSRTGINEKAWTASFQLPEAVVVVTGMNEPNIAGTRMLLDALGRRKETAETLVVTSLVPHGWPQLAAVRRKSLAASLGVTAETLGIELPYEPSFALKCCTVVTDPDWQKTQVVEQYKALADWIVLKNTDDPGGHLVRAREELGQQDFHRALDHYREALKAAPYDRSILANCATLEFTSGSAQAGLDNLSRLSQQAGWERGDLSQLFGVASAACEKFEDAVIFERVVEHLLEYHERTDCMSPSTTMGLLSDIAGRARGLLRPEVIESVCVTAVALYEKNCTDIDVVDRFGNFLGNTLTFHGETGDFARADEYYVRLVELLEHHRDSAELSRVSAAAIHNLRNAYAHAGNLQDAKRMLRLLTELHEAHPDHVGVAEVLSKALFNQRNDVAKTGNLKAAARLLRQLESLHRAYPESAEVRRPLAMGLFNAAYDYWLSGETDACENEICAVRRLASEWPDDRELTGQCVRACALAAFVAARRGDEAACEGALSQLAGLADRHSLDSTDTVAAFGTLARWQSEQPRSAVPTRFALDNARLTAELSAEAYVQAMGALLLPRMRELATEGSLDGLDELLERLRLLLAESEPLKYGSLLFSLADILAPDGAMLDLFGRYLPVDEGALEAVERLSLSPESKERLTRILRKRADQAEMQ